MTVVGFDPGLRRTGFAVVRGPEPVSVAGLGVIAPAPGGTMSERLDHFLRRAGRVLDEAAADEVVIEEVFFSRNPQSTLKLGVVRGILFAAALQREVPVASFSPAEVKMAVCGRGNATKEQVQFMTARLTGLAEGIQEDSADALALCLCFLSHRRLERKVAGS